ncbi:HAMP domain-containing protein [Paenibacillus sp. P26]|nr:HAMP domain-containing protein [Paenibacillus sp. P26]
MSEKDAGLIKLFQTKWDAYAKAFPAILEAAQKHGPDGLRLIRDSNADLSGCTMVIDLFTRNIQEYANGWAGELNRSYQSGVAWVIALSIVAILAGIGISFLIARDVSKPIREMGRAARRVSEGDLSVTNPALKRQDEIGELSAAFSQMTEHMRQMILKINEHAGLVSASAEQSEGKLGGNAGDYTANRRNRQGCGRGSRSADSQHGGNLPVDGGSRRRHRAARRKRVVDRRDRRMVQAAGGERRRLRTEHR